MEGAEVTQDLTWMWGVEAGIRGPLSSQFLYGD